MNENTKTKFDNNAIVIDDGSVRVPIHNLEGKEVGSFSFRPSDINIVGRFEKAMKDIDKIVTPLEHFGITANGTSKEDDTGAYEAVMEATQKMKETVNYIFGDEVADAFFGEMNPFSPVRGRFYCEVVLESLGKFIGKTFDKEFSKANNRVSKYTNQYTHGQRTGRHKNGGKKGKNGKR